MEPTIYIEKYDPSTGKTIDDKASAVQESGNWRAFMVTFPLREPVREIRAATVAFPVPRSPYSNYMTDEEKAQRDAQAE
jgi:hypothetical protein